MLKKTKLAIALVVALSAMGVAASSAFAVSASVSAGGAVNATATATFEGGGISIICPLTMRETLLTGPIAVAANNQIGEVTEVRIARERCSGGNVSGVLGLPWRLTINRTEPAIETLERENARLLLVNVVGASFNLEIFGGFINCLYTGTAGGSILLTRTGAGTYTARTIVALPSIELPLHSGSGCPSSGHFSATFTLSAVQTITLS
jgi:hypothetical protein